MRASSLFGLHSTPEDGRVGGMYLRPWCRKPRTSFFDARVLSVSLMSKLGLAVAASTPHGTMKGNPNEALEFLRNEFVFTSGRSKESELMHTYTVSAFNQDQVKAVINSAARFINA